MELDIEGLLNSQGIDYTNHGHYYKIKCISPYHSDNHPSMTILKENGFARCWSCGATYSYGSLHYALTGESLFKENKDRYNFNFNNSLSKVYKKKDFAKKERKLFIKGQLKNPLQNKDVLDFLKSIYINEDLIRKFEISYMTVGRIAFIDTEKPTKIYNRICIPLYEDNQIVNYECRDYTGKSKPKVLYPKGSKSDILFNIDNLNFSEPLYIVEGIKSALRLYSLGYNNTTATLGSSIGKNQMRLINKIKYPIVFPDSDDAGMSMLKQIEENCQNDIYVTFMQQDGYDPADGTVDELKYAIDNAMKVTDYYLQKYAIFRSEEKIDW